MKGFEASEFTDNYHDVVKNLKLLYRNKIYEVEKKYRFDEFHGQALRASDIDAKPMVLLLGQYSVGKTSFIEYLLKRKFPGIRIGPEPTTDRFVAVMYGEEDQIIPGNALSVDTERPFGGLNKYGSSFLTKFEASICNAPILKNITIVDTPGVLSGEKQRLDRSYDFTAITDWFATRSDLILLLFDAHKLDISDEFKAAIDVLRGNDDKVRVVLNKADAINTQQLMRVYGALMWSLGKVFKTPEVVRVYIGSFWDRPYVNDENSKLFTAEAQDLLEDLLALPSNSAVRKVNELVKRTRLVRCHAHIISHLREKMPFLWGKESKQEELIHNLASEFGEIERTYKIPAGDFPNLEKMKQALRGKDFSSFEKPDEHMFAQISDVLHKDLPKLLRVMQPATVKKYNPFEVADWAVTPDALLAYNEIFDSLNPVNGSVSGNIARDTLLNTGIAIDSLRKIWELSDFEKNGTLDREEFALALYLSEMVKKGKKVPDSLPASFVPPSKRKGVKK
eukprot:TRINITY_DN1731_c0_g1_i3.p1 TRINITY_DN1731_c0_g1~~TRINITY_DN1731_c0_g1_i3.p1  ORF type:complete len:507 (-),score=129.14 TRINITY_DN1731_c0_g1_i3:43-1563(-)